MKILNIDTLKFSIEINNYNSSMRDLLDKLLKRFNREIMLILLK